MSKAGKRSEPHPEAEELQNNPKPENGRNNDALGRRTKETRVLTPTGRGDGANIGRSTTGRPRALPAADVRQGGGDGLIDVTCEYAPNGQLAALIDDNGNRSEWTYDAHGRKIFEVKGLSDDPPGLADRVDGPSTMTWTFNADGALASMTKEDGATLSYDYDSAKRLTAVKKGSTTLQSFEYDGVGRQTESMDANTTGTTSDDATATRYYDSLGRGVEETLKIGSGGTLRAVTTDYTGERRSSLVYPNGRRVDYSCHASGALDTIADNGAGGDPIAEYDYIGGRTLRRKMRNGVNLDLREGSGTRYDSAGLPTRWAYLDTNEQGNPVLIGFEYGYDPGGNKLYQRSIHDPLDSQRYAYDSADRLAAYSRGWFGEGDYTPSSPEYCDAPTSNPWSGMTQAQKWLLDGVGNWDVINTTANDTLTSETRKDTSFNEYYDIGGTAQSHDDNGNLTDDGNQQYTWDLFNRLREVKTSTGSLIVTYVYDSMGRRVREDFPAGSSYTDTDYYYTGWQVLEERSTTGSLLRQYVDGNYIDEHLVMDVNEDADSSCIGANDSRYFYHQNALYSVYGLSDDSGDLLEAYEYDPYGKHILLADGDDGGAVVNFNANDARTTEGASGFGTSYAFTGRQWDGESGLHHYRNRPYSVGRGRFLARDPIGYVEGANVYEYVGALPTAATDPHGLWGTVVHRDVTIVWAELMGYPDAAAKEIGGADDRVDADFHIGRLPVGPTAPTPFGDLSYHFDRPWGGEDSRLAHARDHYLLAVKECCENDDGEAAAIELGTALHPLQDYFAHGDYGKYDEGDIWATHNMYSLQPQEELGGELSDYPDRPDLDARGSPDGRPAGNAMYWVLPRWAAGTVLRGYAYYEYGQKRLWGTRIATEEGLIAFLSEARLRGKPCCKEYFEPDSE